MIVGTVHIPTPKKGDFERWLRGNIDEYFPMLSLEVEKAGEESRIYRIYQGEKETATIELIPGSAGRTQLRVARLEISYSEAETRHEYIDFTPQFFSWVKYMFGTEPDYDASIWRDGPAAVSASAIFQFLTGDKKGILPATIEEDNGEGSPTKERGRTKLPAKIYQERVDKALAVKKAHKNYKVSEIAKAVGVSERTLKRAFKETGQDWTKIA